MQFAVQGKWCWAVYYYFVGSLGSLSQSMSLSWSSRQVARPLLFFLLLLTHIWKLTSPCSHPAAEWADGESQCQAAVLRNCLSPSSWPSSFPSRSAPLPGTSLGCRQVWDNETMQRNKGTSTHPTAVHPPAWPPLFYLTWSHTLNPTCLFLSIMQIPALW